MKNKEKFANEITEIVYRGGNVAVDRKNGEPIACENKKFKCENCICYIVNTCCCENERVNEWAESEYIEKPVISKKDRMFLDFLKDRWKYMARENMANAIYMFTEIPKKTECGYSFTSEARRISTDFNVDFPMIKWSDEEPWLIEDLKKLGVVEEYE